MDKKIFTLVAPFWLIGLLIGIVPNAFGDVFAEENRAEALYGQGVHAFYGNDYQEAIRLLSDVEKLKSEDPRPYFFLGLAYGRSGQVDTAAKCLEKAAWLECEGRSARDYKVSDALRRIQGYERLTVEGYRAKARAEWRKEDRRKQEIKFGIEKKKDREIVTKMTRPSVERGPFGASTVNPFATSSAPAPAPATAAEPATETDIAMPAAAPLTQPVKKAQGDDPFGAADEKEEKPEPKKPEEKKPEPKKPEPADDDDDPFS